MGRFDRFAHFEAGDQHNYLRSGVLLLLFLVVCLLCAPIGAIAAEGSIEKDLQADLGRSRVIVENIEAKLAKGAAIGPDLGQLKTVAENIRITDLLMEERFKLREERVKSLGAKAVDRHEAMVKGYRKALTEYLALIDKLPSDGTIKQSAVDKLRSLLDKLLPKKHRPIIGSLPYKHLNYPAIEPSTAPAITPAYKGGNKTVSPDDTRSTPEAPISKEIAALAQSLNWQPVAIYEHVKNTIETEWYWGCQKGAEETLRQKSGNDCDQALLLSSLLKASGFPTRLVQGNIQFFASDDKPIERIKNLIGIDDSAKMAEFFQKAGIPYKPIIAGGKIANFEISHIYVESQIPYANYRGIVIDDHGKVWLGLDTAIKTTDYVYNTPNDLFEQPELGDRLTGLRDEYLALDLNSQPSTTQSATPLEYLQSSINSELLTLNSQLTYSNFLRTKTLTPEPMKFLPASLQFNLIKAIGEYIEIPDELVHKVKFTAIDANKNELFNITLPLYRLSNQQIAITYEPETVEDQEIIDSYGGLDNTPSYLIRLRPVLKLNGERIVVATDGLPMGADYNLRIELYSSSVNEGATAAETINNTMITGNLSVIGITAQKAVTTPSPLAGEGGGEGEKDAERLLYESAQHYIDRWNKTEDELASLLHLTTARPLPTVVMVGGIIDVTYLLDIPHGFTWKGVYVDADLRRIEAVRSVEFGVGSEGEREKMFMRLSSLQGSILENRIFEDDFQVQSISTAKLMAVANGSQLPIITIDKTNIDSVLPELPFDQSIKDDIVNSVNQNLSIKIPSEELSYENWTGIGFIKENQATGESGWMLSGSIAGGMTVWSDDRWPQYYLDTLSNPYSEPPNLDPASANYIQKITSDDLQQGTVGMLLSRPLQVKVMDHAWHPVPNVNVTFTVKAGGGSFSDGTTIKTAQTNTQGIASVPFIAGKYTKDNPVFWWYDNHLTQPYPEQVGENLVDAFITSTRAPITTPFAVYGFPKTDSPYRVKNLHGDGLANSILFLSGFVSLIAEDAYGNPKSNIPLSFKINDAEIDSTPPNCSNPAYAQTSKKAYFIRLSEACVFQAPVWGTCADTQEQTVDMPSNHLGAQLEVMLGGVPDAKYKIEAACSPSAACRYYEYTCPQGQPCDYLDNGKPMVTYTHYTHYHCGESQLYLESFYTTDAYGYLKNAQKVVDPPTAPLTIPVMAKLYAIQNGDIVTNLESASVTFNNIASTVQSNGTYTANVPITIVGLNQIKIEGKATIDGTVKSAGPFNLPVYGVKINADPIPLIATDQQGYTLQDTKIKYTILPMPPDPYPYSAMTAAVHIYKNSFGNDVLIEAIRSEVTGTGSATIGRGFKFDLGSIYKVQVVLNYGSGTEMRGERITLRYSDLYVEKVDPEYPAVKLRWDDYYPALGAKKIVVRGYESGGTPLNNVNIGSQVLMPSSGVSLTPSIATFVNGRAEFQISAIGLAPPLNNDPVTGVNEIKIKFFLISANNQPQGDIQDIWHVKNNSNTNLQDVLDGKAVFVYDTSSSEAHQGKTTGLTDNKRGLDFVQRMMNHVIAPLRRSVVETNLKNSFDVDGYFGNKTKQALEAIINGSTEPAGSSLADTKVSHHIDETSSPNTFRKLIKDYDGLTNADIGKVISKEILVGLNKSDTDTSPVNNNDIGIYEMYFADDWDGDGLSNYVEVKNGIDPLIFNDNYLPKLQNGSTVPTNITSPLLAYPQGTYSDGRLINGLRMPHSSKGYYQQRGTDAVNSDNYALPDILGKIERVARLWDARHPDLAPLKTNVFSNGDTDNNLYTADGRENPDGTPQTNGIRIGTNDFSRAGGGRFCWVESNGEEKCHNSHHSGLDVDVRYIRNDNAESGVKVTEVAYDESLSRELVSLFITEVGAIRVFAASGSNIAQNGIVIHEQNHADHFHVAFANPNPPNGIISLQATAPQVEESTGYLTSTISTANSVRDRYGLPLFGGFKVKIATDGGTIYYNDIAKGQQATIPLDDSGNIRFQIKASSSGMAHVTVETPNIYDQGQAIGSIGIDF